MKYKSTVTLHGTHGSMPCSGKEYLQYGGRSTCVLVQLAGETLLLDSGSGMVCLKPESVPSRQLTLLLSHAHVDHLLVLPMCPLLTEKDTVLDLYAATPRDGHNAWFAAAKLGQDCGAKQVRIIHHAPDRTDDELNAAAVAVQPHYPNCRFGYDEEVILL